MSLHDRITKIEIDDSQHDLRSDRERISYGRGYREARLAAAILGQEADELMAEMAAALEEAMEWNWMDEIEPVPDRVEYQVTDALSKYKAMKESAK